MIDRAVFPIRRRKHARPRELLVAARDLFIEKGFAASRTDDIAARAGVSKGTLYLYFDSKEDLLNDLIAQRFFCRFPFESFDGHESTMSRSSAELLRGLAEAWRATLIDAHVGGVVKLVFTEAQHCPALADFWVRQVMTPTRAVVSRIVKHGMRRGEFRAIDPDLVVSALVLPVIATCLHRHAIERYAPCGSVSAEHEAPGRHVEFVLRALHPFAANHWEATR